MAFSASTCVTNLGGIDINSTVKIRTYPGEIQIGGDIILSAMTGVNCPYTITGIPNGTTELQIYVPGTNVCGYIDISDNDLCNTCDLGFDSFTSSTIGNIVVGNLTGSCQNPITDYRILWFGPSESMEVVSTNVARISGKGSAFTYNYQHPLTGISSLPMEQGYYRPVIDKVRINGVNFSYTGGTGYVPADLECFDSLPVYVSGYTCENGKETIGDYTHRVNFTSTGSGLSPTPLTSTFILSGGTTNFFAWKFKGEIIPDQLKLTFFGTEYGLEPIILEWWEVGSIPSLNTAIIQNTNTFPKSANTISYISKVTTLTGLTINDGDRILLEVIPSKTNFNTNWDFYFTCLETFNCDTCLDSYENESYKIVGSSITGITGTCGNIDISVTISGCNESTLLNSDLIKYFYQNPPESNVINNHYYVRPFTFPLNNFSDLRFNGYRCSPRGFGGIINCSNSGNYISFEKTVTTIPPIQGNIYMEFSGSSSLTDFNSFYNGYLYWKNSPSYSGSTDNTNYDYYRYWILPISTATGDTYCGDSTTYYDYYIHYPTAVVTTGLTGSGYWLNITMPTISDGILPNSCELQCDYWRIERVGIINTSSTGSTNNRKIYSNRGAKYQSPFQIWDTGRSNNPSTSGEIISYLRVNNNMLNTIPSSGSSNTLIHSLSGQTCDYSSYGVFNTNGRTPPTDDGLYYYEKNLYAVKLQLTNPSDVRDFDIYMSPINNFVYSGYPGNPNYELAYSYSGGSVVYSSSTYII
jgi:hypothetical protein